MFPYKITEIMLGRYNSLVMIFLPFLLAAILAIFLFGTIWHSLSRSPNLSATNVDFKFSYLSVTLCWTILGCQYLYASFPFSLFHSRMIQRKMSHDIAHMLKRISNKNFLLSLYKGLHKIRHTNEGRDYMHRNQEDC